MPIAFYWLWILERGKMNMGQIKWLACRSRFVLTITCFNATCTMPLPIQSKLQTICRAFKLLSFPEEILTLFVLGLGWVGRVPLAFMLLTNLLKADMSVSCERGWALEQPVKASSKCSAIKGVPFPLWGGGTFRACDSDPSFIPFISPSTSSRDSTTPQLAGDKRWNCNIKICSQNFKCIMKVCLTIWSSAKKQTIECILHLIIQCLQSQTV